MHMYELQFYFSIQQKKIVDDFWPANRQNVDIMFTNIANIKIHE